MRFALNFLLVTVAATAASAKTEEMTSPRSTNIGPVCERVAREWATRPVLFLDPSRILSLREGDEADEKALEWHRQALSAAHASNNTRLFAEAITRYIASAVNATDPATLAYLADSLAAGTFSRCPILNLPSSSRVLEWALCLDDTTDGLLAKKHLHHGAEKTHRDEHLPSFESLYLSMTTQTITQSANVGVVLLSLLYSAHGKEALLPTTRETFVVKGRRTSLYDEAEYVEEALSGAPTIQGLCYLFSRAQRMRKELGNFHFLAVVDKYVHIINGMGHSSWTGRFLASAHQMHKEHRHIY